MNKRVESIKNWLKNPLNLALVAILIFAFAIRLYFFIKVGNQTLWWDEAEYGSLAKKWAFGVPYEANPQRPPLFQLLGAIIFMIGLGESFLRFSLVLIPSTIAVLSIYLLGKEMYNQKIGLIASFLTAVSWTLLFWGARIQPDFASLALGIFSLLFMWKYWKKQEKNELGKYTTKLIILSAFLAALSFYFKISGLLVPMIVVIFILVKDRISAFRSKDYWIYAITFLITMIPYFIWAKLSYGQFLAFRTGYSNQVINNTPIAGEVISFIASLLNPSLSFDLNNHSLFYNFGHLFTSLFNINSILYIFFFIGTILALRFLLYSDILIKDKKKCLNADLFSVISLLYIAAFYIFYQRAIEDRWLFLWLPFMFFFIGNALKFIYKKIKPYNKYLAVILVVGLLAFGAYSQLKHANELIKSKKDSYNPVELAGIWMKSSSSPEDIILSRSKTQNTYYSERKTKSYNDFKNISEMNDYIAENHPKFFVISIFEPNPDWTQNWMEKNVNRLEAVQAYSEDGQNPLLVIYQIKY